MRWKWPYPTWWLWSRVSPLETVVVEEVLVNLVHDPFRIYAGEGQRIVGLAEEIKAFHAIADLLRQPSDPATRRPRMSRTKRKPAVDVQRSPIRIRGDRWFYIGDGRWTKR